MAVSRGISLRLCAVALATVLVLFLNIEVGQGQAPAPGPSACDVNAIETVLVGPCLNETTIPTPGSPCCNAVNYVYDTIRPSEECICDLIDAYGQYNATIKAVIISCEGAAAVPVCL